MINPREKGKRFELKVAQWWRERHGGEVRRSKTVNRDLDNAGVDLVGTDPFLIQCKAVERNLHYLPIPLRAKFLDALMDITNNNKYDETTKFEVSYEYLNRAAKFKYFKPCFKHYLTTQVEGRLAYVPPPEWEIATFLPVAQWNKGTAGQVYKDSRRIMNA